MQIPFNAGVLAALVVSSLASWTPAHAGPSDYVISPIVEEGEREIDIKLGTAKLRDGSHESAHSVGFGWGATRWWFTELYAKWHKPAGERNSFDAWEWENRFQLTETGRFPVDVGVLLEIERPKDRSEGYEYRWGPLLQAEWSRVVGNLNLLVEKHVRSADASAAELGYQWQLRYRWLPAFEFGVQGFGALGPWDHWASASQQTHIAGPTVYGRFKVAERQVVKYNAGWLRGTNGASPRNTFRMQAEYEF